MENAVLDRPPVSEAVVDIMEEGFSARPARAETEANGYWIPVALVLIAGVSIATALLAGIRLANIGS